MESHTIESRPRVAVLTGGSRGIGRSAVKHLAAQGVNVVFTYHSDAAAAEEAKAEAKTAHTGPRTVSPALTSISPRANPHRHLPIPAQQDRPCCPRTRLPDGCVPL